LIPTQTQPHTKIGRKKNKGGKWKSNEHGLASLRKSSAASW